MPGQSDSLIGNVRNVFVVQFVASFGAASANTTTQQTGTLPGLQVGDIIVELAKTTFQAGLAIVYSDVSAANTIRVTFGNFTGGGITPTAGDTYTATIFRPSNLSLPSIIQ